MDDLNQLATQYGNLVISLVAAMGMFYFMWRALRIEYCFRAPVVAIAMILGGVLLRIAPWAYAQATSAACDAADQRVICLYNLDIIAFRPWFTLTAAALILWGALKFRRWIDRKSLGNKLMWASGVCAAAFILTGL